ncbi:beta-lactamase/transpeptidase-like protein [Penicillium verhagenii]|uniref:beta-lactamase/transpeptidase-like protein n=1 Tax=Penicillium verhagenii TaxID=1562060 RepID=UPI0025457037|nr:beta-lactamase/transpeptidase-like protein [Penicillium verhagenii]KAJ5938973.1 beta-lactamase/transpeptidase-like protein [Penicillium verhagenii]
MAGKQTVQEILDSIPLKYRGPGGAIAVVKDGELIGQRVWGYADIDKRIPLTPEIRMPICSITKQFVCALLMDLKRNPTPEMTAKGDVQAQFSEALRELVRPELTQDSGLTLDNLCDMQSGLRDYWAMTALWGTKPDDEFLVERDCPPMVDRTKSFHFKPGTEFSYCNVNFYLVARVIERVAGESLGKLLAERILGPAGMETAFLCPDNAKLPTPCVGYEGTEELGFVPAVNRMEWSGDAGLVASLTDMIAWEKHLDSLFSDSKSWYHKVTKGTTYSDGTPAHYHNGLSSISLGGVDNWGHGGALRGYRLHRRHAMHERLSVVALFNHEAEASSAVEDIMRAILNKPKPVYTPVEANPAWLGSFLDRDTQLLVTISKGPATGELHIAYSGDPETIKLTDPTHGENLDVSASIDGDVLYMNRIGDNRKLVAQRLVPSESSFKDNSLRGDYKSAEVDSFFHCEGEAGMLYGALDGFLGQGTITAMKYIGDDVWVLRCPRGLDAPAPGDWTMAFHRDNNGSIIGFKIGCWLARGVNFVKV